MKKYNFIRNTLTVWLFFLSTSQLLAQSSEAFKAYQNQNYRSASRLYVQVCKQEPANAEAFYQWGNTLCYLSNYDSAQIVYQAGINGNSKYAPNFCGLAKVALHNKDNAKAIEYIKQAKALAGNKDVNYYVWVADAYLNQDNPNAQEAINQLKKGLEINYKNADVYMLMGDAYFSLQNGGDAVNNYELALQYNPSLYAANSKIGIVWTYARKYTESLNAFQKALSSNAEYAPALKGLSDLYYATGQFDKAKEVYEKYMKVADVDNDIRYQYAQLLFLTKDYSSALNLINEVKSSQPDKYVMYRLAGYSYYETGEYDKGLQELNTFFIKADPKRILGSDYEYLGKLYQKKGNDSLMIVNYEKAVSIDTSKRYLLGDIATSFYQKKNFKKAAYYYDKKIKAISKPTIQDYFTLGRAHYFDSAYAKADTAFLKVTELSNVWVQGYLWRARCNQSLDNPDAPAGLASPFYEKVIELGSADVVKYKKELNEAYQYFGNYYIKVLNYQEAINNFEKALANDPDNADLKASIDYVKSLMKPKK
jgi:tetratricopeptide (TPR) repeat protein